jgi:DNA (cytosine-5)-methyltransferase 1
VLEDACGGVKQAIYSRVRSRLVTARETARLMGLPDSYELPERYNEAYHLTGDGVVVPVISHLSKHLLLPAIMQKKPAQTAKKKVRAA